MADITSESNTLVTGYKCEVWAGDSASSAKKIGMVDSFTASKNLQTQRAQVIGTIMPVSIDPQALSASITMSGFIAKNQLFRLQNTEKETQQLTLSVRMMEFIQVKLLQKFLMLH